MAAKHGKKEEQGEKIKVDGTVINVKTPPPSKVRPVYYCQTCETSFPSQLDLDEHMKIDHKDNSKKDNNVVA
jgi:DNA replicative helicase MCM subunit Mcm2 (Cdc46/Mcm family)